ncbi:MAG: methyltransferase domain-containing protein [Deltaproteobacteria bacterium]|nr:methyltransferase domain-containing protein [Deltaproteobacteria bacterium]
MRPLPRYLLLLALLPTLVSTSAWAKEGRATGRELKAAMGLLGRVEAAYQQARSADALGGVLAGTPLVKAYPRGTSDALYVTEKARTILANYRAGAPLDPYIGRALELLGIDRTELDVFTRVAHQLGTDRRVVGPASGAGVADRAALRQARLATVLAQAEQLTTLADPALERVARNIVAARFWEQYGRPERAKRAKATAERLGTSLGLDLQAAFAVPFTFTAGYGAYERRPVPSPSKGVSTPEAPLERSGPRRTSGHPQWWTGAPAAHLELVYRGLPALLKRRFEDFRAGKPAGTLRVWHAGFEDTSQTFFLAAALDEAVRRTARAHPEMRPFLAQLELEIVATDHLQQPKRRGRSFTFGDTEVVHELKSSLVLDEFGRAVPGKARAELKALERASGADLEAQPTPELLSKLADAGKVPELLGRFFGLGELRTVERSLVGFAYRLKDRRWRIEDTINGITTNPSAKPGRRIRFVRADLTAPTAPLAAGSADLVLCTNVLPYLALYGEKRRADRDTRGLQSAMAQIQQVLKPTGALAVDSWSSPYLIEEALPGLLGQMEQRGQSIWVATHNALVSLEQHLAR